MSSFFISYSDLFLTKPKVRSGHGCSNVGQCYLRDKLLPTGYVDQLCYQLRDKDLSSLVPRPVRATRITRGGLEPSAIGWIFPTSLTGDVKSEIKSTTGNEAEIYLLDSVIQRLNNWGLVKSDLYTWLPPRNVRQTMRELMLEINLQFSTY